MTAPKYDKWKRKELWTIFQGACVCSGIEPFDGPTLADALANIKDENKRELIRDIYSDAKDAIDVGKLTQANRSRSGRFMDKLVIPAEFVAWSSSRGYSVPGPLQSLAKTIEEKPLGVRAETTYLNIIGALCELYWREISPVPDKEIVQQTIIDDIMGRWPNVPGLKERTLKDKLSVGIRTLRESKT